METSRSLCAVALAVLVGVAVLSSGRHRSAQAQEADPQAKAAPVVERLEKAIADGDKFAAWDALDELETLIPEDERLPKLREQVAAVPGTERELTLDVGNGVTMELIAIRPGRFAMGSRGDERGRDTDEGPQHRVTITRPFYMGKYEVTQAQFEAVMGENPSACPGADNPVEKVSWQAAREFCQKLGQRVGREVRLPTEAEWEYACRAGTRTIYSFGDDPDAIDEHEWYAGNSDGKPHPVGRKPANPWGLHDMHGNVREWCQDAYDAGYYARSPRTDPPGSAEGETGVIRGGSWRHSRITARSAGRYGGVQGAVDYSGLRVVVPIP
jgi:formylglycine-generating enzyme required for sulfatase activity